MSAVSYNIRIAYPPILFSVIFYAIINPMTNITLIYFYQHSDFNTQQVVDISAVSIF